MLIWDDDGIEAPSRPVLCLAEEVAHALRRWGYPAPMRVLPDGEGGVLFERRCGAVYETLTILVDSTIELECFVSGHMVLSECVDPQRLLRGGDFLSQHKERSIL